MTLLVASAVIVCFASLTGHAEAASLAIGARLAASPAHARLRSPQPPARNPDEAPHVGGISSPKGGSGTGRTLPAWSLRSILTRSVGYCSTSIVGMRRASRGHAIDERDEMPLRRASTLRSRAKRTRSAGRGVSSSQLQANRSGESNIAGASAREELATPPPLRAPPSSGRPAG